MSTVTEPTPDLEAVKRRRPGGTIVEEDLRALVCAWNRLPDGGPVAVPGAYLESIGTRA